LHLVGRHLQITSDARINGLQHMKMYNTENSVD